MLHSISIFAIAACLFYVFFIWSGLFSWTVDTLGIKHHGPQGPVRSLHPPYLFSPTFRGYGIGWVTRYISIMNAAGIGVFGTHDFGGMHNDLVTMYIELGFWGFSFWIWLSWAGQGRRCQKQYGTETASCCCMHRLCVCDLRDRQYRFLLLYEHDFHAVAHRPRHELAGFETR